MKKNTKVQKTAGKQKTKFEQQLEAEPTRMQQAGEICGVVGLDVGDKRSYRRLVGLDGEPALVPPAACSEGELTARRRSETVRQPG